MAEYQLATAAADGPVKRTEGDYTLVIPNDPANRDWQVYQQWLADGGVPDPYVAPLDVNPLDMKTSAEILGGTT